MCVHWVCVSPSQDEDSPRVFTACRAFRNLLNLTTAFQGCGNEGLREMTCLTSHHSPEREVAGDSEMALPAPQHQPLLIGGGHSLSMAQPLEEGSTADVPALALTSGQALCRIVYMARVIPFTPHHHLPKEMFQSTFRTRRREPAVSYFPRSTFILLV